MKSLNLVIAILLFSNILHAQKPGTTDNTFGEDGLVTNAFLFTNCNAVVVDKSERVFTSGRGRYTNNSRGLMVARYLSDGSLDVEYGDSGRAVSNTEGQIYSMVIQDDQKIVTGGFSNNEGIQLIRYTENGSLDETFGNNGIVNTVIAPKLLTASSIQDIGLQKDGKIVVTGYGVFSNYVSFIARYNTDGTLDRSFGDTGVIVCKFQNEVYLTAMSLQEDGKIIVAGSEDRIFLNDDYLLARYLPDGSVDSTFGKNGISRFTFEKNIQSVAIADMVLQKDGKIIAAGQAGPNNITYLTLVRFNSDGSVDSTFADDGAFIKIDDEVSAATSINLTAAGKIVTGGRSNKYNFLAMQFLNNGGIDSAFGENGEAGALLQNGNGGSSASTIQKNGKIVITGLFEDADEIQKSAVVRLYGDPVKQLGPIAKKIRRWIRNHTLQWQPLNDNSISYYSIQQSSNGVSGFKEIGRIAAVSHQSSNVYSYDLNSPSLNSQPSSNYYRVTAVSDDGNNIVSDVIADDNGFTVTVSPNPVKNVLKISGLPANQKTVINIVNRNGNVLQSAIAQSSYYSLNVAQLKTGVYSVLVTVNNQSRSIKFVKE